jgi:hypothetical protein
LYGIFPAIFCGKMYEILATGYAKAQGFFNHTN